MGKKCYRTLDSSEALYAAAGSGWVLPSLNDAYILNLVHVCDWSLAFLQLSVISLWALVMNVLWCAVEGPIIQRLWFPGWDAGSGLRAWWCICSSRSRQCGFSSLLELTIRTHQFLLFWFRILKRMDGGQL